MTVDVVWNRQTVTEPGIYAEVPIATYHEDTKLLDGFSISSSGLRAAIDRPSAYWVHSPFNPKRLPKPSSDALDFGKAAHHLLLGEADFRKHFALRPEVIAGKLWQGNRNECKEWTAARLEAGLTIVKPDQIDAIRHMRDSLSAHPIVAQGALSGRVERSMFAKIGGIWLRARPDVIPRDSNDFVDLKTAASIDDESLSRTIFNNGYHIQAAVVRMVWRELGHDFGGFVLAFLEKSPPYEVRLFEVRTQDIDLGERQARIAIRTVGECLKRGVWPGYDGWDPTVLNIDIPAWARTRIDADLAQKEAA